MTDHQLAEKLDEMRAILRSGACGQREVWERHLASAAVRLRQLHAELEYSNDQWDGQ